MKKVKIMLMSLTLLAIVGGALAFKAKFNVIPYCTTITTDAGENPTCPVLGNYTTTDSGPVHTLYYTLPDIDDDCATGDNDEFPLPCEDLPTTFTTAG